MEITSRHLGTVVVAAPVGRIDHASSPTLEQALAPLWNDANVTGLIFDFAGVDYISSIGLRVLMIAAKHMRARHARIAVTALQPIVAEIFAISRFNVVLEVFPTLNDALAALAPQAPSEYNAA